MGTTLEFRSHGSSPNNRQTNTSFSPSRPTKLDTSTLEVCNLLFIISNLVPSFTINLRVALSSTRSSNLVIISFTLSLILLLYNECFEKNFLTLLVRVSDLSSHSFGC
ncbi:hypothetical protein Hanom_Chr06g00498151 [Helianthus anomalus]